LRNKELSAANDSVRRQTEQLEEQAQSLRTANAEMEQIAQELIQQRILLQQKNEALNSANTEKSKILSIAAHDLKNPLTDLKGMLEILRSGDDFKPAYLHRMSSTMQQSVDRMFNIIKNLLDLQALDEGAVKLEIKVFDMVSATKTIVDSYRLSAAHKRISLELKANVSEVPCLADRKLFLQIADNLVSNAIKYSPPQKRVLVRTVSVQHAPTIAADIGKFGIVNTSALHHFEINTPMALLIVHDEGPGLTEEDQMRLFQKFARLSAQPTGGEHSTGLGLSISKRLTESMNGVIWCESTSQEGARFVVAFGMPIV
jgi:signal transduction histidine kinase